MGSLFGRRPYATSTGEPPTVQRPHKAHDREYTLFERKMPLDNDSVATNLAGSIIFWSYIVAALAATARALVYIRKDAVIAPSSPAISRARRVFSWLALCSFTCLSYHMMNVLILSYSQWSVARHLRIPTCLIGHGCLLGKSGTSLDLWQWSTTSTLFQDFGDALVLNNARWAWSSASLALTFVNVAYMCIAGEIPWSGAHAVRVYLTSFQASTWSLREFGSA